MNIEKILKNLNIHFDLLEWQKIEETKRKEDSFNDLINDSFIPDLSKRGEQLIKKEIQNFLSLSLEDLEKINEDKAKRREFYKLFNTVLYNNFHDIASILKSYGKKHNLNINEEEKAEFNLLLDNIKFTANVKSLDRIIEKVKRKNKNSIGELSDVVRGRIDCQDINQALEILKILKEKLPSQNKEIEEIDNMIENPRTDYKGRIHLKIKDKETGITFELQIGSKNISNFIERPVSINYGEKVSQHNNTLLVENDIFYSNYHDLIYKATKKLKQNPKYKYLSNSFNKIEQMYSHIMDDIFQSEKNGTYYSNEQKIQGKVKELDDLLVSTFSQVAKEDLISTL